MDKMSKEQRHRCMASIPGKGTKPELTVRKYLFAHGFRYRLNHPRLPGKPDIVLRKYRTVIFVNGCFWHGHEGCRPSLHTDKTKRSILKEPSPLKCREPESHGSSWKIPSFIFLFLKKIGSFGANNKARISQRWLWRCYSHCLSLHRVFLSGHWTEMKRVWWVMGHDIIKAFTWRFVPDELESCNLSASKSWT